MHQFIHFENWTSDLTISTLTSIGLPHDGKVIKVFATEFDPRVEYERPSLLTIPVPDEEFTIAEQFDYGDRGIYTGLNLETGLNRFRLADSGKRMVRALFRFANKPEMGFCQRAMQAQLQDGSWLINHPFEDIDGIRMAENNDRRINSIHLDVFFPESIKALKRIVDLTDGKPYSEVLSAL